MERLPAIDVGKALELFAQARDLAASAREKSESFNKMMQRTLERMETRKAAAGPHAKKAEVLKLEPPQRRENGGRQAAPQPPASPRYWSPGSSRRSAWRNYWRPL